jgi:hypothetical protein
VISNVHDAPAARGRSNAAIAQRLVISEHAVAKHTAPIFLRLDLQPSDDDNRARARRARSPRPVASRCPCRVIVAHELAQVKSGAGSEALLWLIGRISSPVAVHNAGRVVGAPVPLKPDERGLLLPVKHLGSPGIDS